MRQEASATQTGAQDVGLFHIKVETDLMGHQKDAPTLGSAG